jgi:tetratricopeptide (TPR) repeat protein
LIVATAALAVSCVARERGAQVKLPAPQPAMEQQINNAVNAGVGDYQLRLLQQRVAAEPDNLQARLELARQYRALGSPELALEHYRLAAARFPDSPEVQLLLVKAMRDTGQRLEAVKQLDTFLESHPQKSPQYASWVGIMRDELQQWTEGERAHREAVALDPKVDTFHNNLGYNLLKQGKAEAAAGEFREALRINPLSTVARNNLGMALANKPEQAVLNWRAAADPATAHNNMAALWIEQGRYVEARKELDIALGYNRSHTAALNNLRLVSELDGKPAYIPFKPLQGRWAKVKSGLWKAFVDDRESERSTENVKSPENRKGL